MHTLVGLHHEALATATIVIERLEAAAWKEPSRCAGWTVGHLMRHMVGQNFGFAAALREGDAPREAYEPRSVDEWAASVAALRRAVSAPAETIRLAEVRPHLTFPSEVVLGFHLLDTVVHSWDICGPPWRPEAEVAEVIFEQARRIPDTARRDAGPFSAVIEGDFHDPWLDALRLLGRNPRTDERPVA